MKRKSQDQQASSKRSRSTRTQSPPPQTADCGICFEDKYKYSGKIDSCAHSYCFECISKWSKSSTLCPQCKRRFKEIKKVDAKNSKTSQVVKCRRRDLGDSSAAAAAAGPPPLPFNIQAFGPFGPLNFHMFDNVGEDDDDDDDDIFHHLFPPPGLGLHLGLSSSPRVMQY